MTLWIRHYWADDNTVTYYELDNEGWATRQVSLEGTDQRPTTAATLPEVLHLRDHGTIADLQTYESRYGVLAEGDIRGWDETDGVVTITEAEFTEAWNHARQYLDRLS